MKKSQNTSLSLRKVLLSALVAAPLATLPAPLWALPVTSGNMTSSSSSTVVSTTTNTLTITTPDRTVLKWVDFGAGTSLINTGETVSFNLPSTTSSVLNMVTGTNPTSITGTLTSNGKILLLNPNGITLNSGAQITAAGVSLSTRPETEFQYQAAGDLAYNGTPTSGIILGGGSTITVGSSGTVVLQARDVAIAGNVDAGILNLTTAKDSGGAGGTVSIGGSSDVVFGNVSGKYGAVSINTNGGTLNVTSGTNNVIVAGGNATLNTSGAAVSQGGTGTLVVGDTANNGTLNVNAGAAAVTLSKVSSANTKALNANITGTTVSVTDTSGDLNLAATTSGNLTAATSSGSLTLNASSVGGNLSATATGGDIKSGGAVTMTSTAGTVTLSAASAGKAITFATTGVLNLASITSNSTGSVTLSTTGDVALPAITSQKLSVTTTGGNITQTGVLTVSGDGTFDAAKTTLTNASNDFGGLILKNNAGGVSINDANSVTLKDGTNTTGDVTITANSAVILGTASADKITVGGNLTLTTTSNGPVTVSVTAAGTGYTAVPTVTVSGGGGTGAAATAQVGLTGYNAPTIKGSGYTSVPAVTLSGGGGSGATATAVLGLATASGAATGTGYSVNDAITFAGGGGTGATATVAAVDSAGQITAINITAPGSGYTSMPTATITSAGTGATGIVLTGGVVSVTAGTAGTGYTSLPTVGFAAPPSGGTAPSGASVATANVTGVAVTTAGSGYTSAPAITFSASGSTVTAAATTAFGSAITDGSDNVTVGGWVQITSPGVVVLNGSTGNGVGLKSSYGQFNASASTLTVFENTELNLGTITTGNLLAWSATKISNSGKITATTAKVGAGSATAPGAINLDFTSSSVAGNALGTVTLLSDLELLGSSTVGNYLASSLTVVNDGAVSFNVPLNIYGAGLTGNVSLTSVNAGVTLGTSTITGLVSLNGKTGVTANSASTAVSTYNVTSNGTVDVQSTVPVTFNATLTGTGTANFQGADQVTLGTVTSSTTGAVTFKTTKNSVDISDSIAGGLNIFGPVTFDSAGGVNVTKLGHSFGGVTIKAGNNRAVSLTESGTLKLVALTLTGGNSTIALTSTNGDILQDTSGAGFTGGNSSKTATFTANLGKVTLNDTDNASGEAISVSSSGNVALSWKSDLTLAGITTGGTLTIDNTTVASKKVTQASGSKVWAYGDTSVATSGGDITLANTGNNFGGLILSSGAGNISITEGGTLNIKSLQSSGVSTVKSENADIINTADSTVALNKINVGTASFNAKGNVTLNLSGSTFGGASTSFTTGTGGSVSIVQSAGNLVFGNTTVGGNLTATTQGAGASITQLGGTQIAVTGNTTLTTSAGSVVLSQSANSFVGPFRFAVGLSSTITDSASFVLNAGSVATAPVIINTNGNFSTSGTGGSSFTSDLTINAIGTIIPTSGSLLVTGTFTVFSNNQKDLSGLSKSGNLAGKDPVNLGSGAYSAPSP